LARAVLAVAQMVLRMKVFVDQMEQIQFLTQPLQLAAVVAVHM
jgi:hypothetical protein